MSLNYIVDTQSGYVRGWDDCLIGNANNPYSRRDWRARWARGFKDCREGKPLPLGVKLFLGYFDNQVADYFATLPDDKREAAISKATGAKS